MKEAALGKRERRGRAIAARSGATGAYRTPGAGGGVAGRNWLLASQTQFWGLWGASEWSRLVGGSPKEAARLRPTENLAIAGRRFAGLFLAFEKPDTPARRSRERRLNELAAEWQRILYLDLNPLGPRQVGEDAQASAVRRLREIEAERRRLEEEDRRDAGQEWLTQLEAR